MQERKEPGLVQGQWQIPSFMELISHSCMGVTFTGFSDVDVRGSMVTVGR